MLVQAIRSRGIGLRLWMGFGVVLALLVGNASLSLNGLHHLQQQADELISHHIDALDTIGQMQDVSAQRAILLRDLVLNDNLQAQRVATGRLKSNEQVYAETSGRLSALAGQSWLHASGDDIRKTLELIAQVTGQERSAMEMVADARFDEAKTFLAQSLTPKHEEIRLRLRQSFVATMADANQSVTANREGYRTTFAVIAGAVVLAIGVGVAIAFVVTRGITVPVARARQLAAQVASGDLTQPLETGAADEIGQLITTLESMRAKLASMVGQVHANADSLSLASLQVSATAQSMSQGASEQAASVEETSASVEQMTATIAQNAQNARQASELAVSGSEVARKGGQVVGQVVSTMEDISESSRRIADIIGVIDSIAFQTNILALNAAVEAARAGEQGRGFAVVAAEVRNLAQRSAAAAKEIKTLIGDSADKVAAGTRLVDAAGQTMEEIVASVRKVSDLIAEIAAASQEQSTSVGQINNTTLHLSQISQQNASSSEQLAATSQEMSGQARHLQQLIAFFKIAARGTGEAAPAKAPLAQSTSPHTPPAARVVRRAEPDPLRLASGFGELRAARGSSGAGQWKEF